MPTRRQQKKTTEEEVPYSKAELDDDLTPPKTRKVAQKKTLAQVKPTADAKKRKPANMGGARQRDNEEVDSGEKIEDDDQFGALDRSALKPAAQKFVQARQNVLTSETPDSRRPVQAVARGPEEPELFAPDFTPYRSIGAGSAVRAERTLRPVAYTEINNGKSYYSQGVLNCLKGILFYMVKVYYIHVKVFCIYLYKYIKYLYNIT